jgi:hypothetical protein
MKLTKIKFIRPEGIANPKYEHFYDSGIAVWPAAIPQHNFKQFVALDSIFSGSGVTHAAVDQDGNYLVAIEPHRTISFCDLKTKARIFALLFPHEEPTAKHVQWINNHTVMITDDYNHLWQIDLRNFRMIELLDQQIAVFEQQMTVTEKRFKSRSLIFIAMLFLNNGQCG